MKLGPLILAGIMLLFVAAAKAPPGLSALTESFTQPDGDLGGAWVDAGSPAQVITNQLRVSTWDGAPRQSSTPVVFDMHKAFSLSFDLSYLHWQQSQVSMAAWCNLYFGDNASGVPYLTFVSVLDEKLATVMFDCQDRDPNSTDPNDHGHQLNIAAQVGFSMSLWDIKTVTLTHDGAGNFTIAFNGTIVGTMNNPGWEGKPDDGSGNFTITTLGGTGSDGLLSMDNLILRSTKPGKGNSK